MGDFGPGAGELWRALDAEGVAERAEDAAEGGCCGDELVHGGVGEEVFELGARDGDAGAPDGEVFDQPAVAAGGTMFERAGDFRDPGWSGATGADLPGGGLPVGVRGWDAGLPAGEQADEAAGEAVDARPHHDHQGDGDAGADGFVGGGFDQQIEYRGEALDGRGLG